METGDRVVRMTLPPRSDDVGIESDIDVFKKKERWRRLRQWGLEVEGERKLPKPDQEEERWEEERQRIRGRGWELMSEQRLLKPDIEEERRRQLWRDLGPYLGPELESERNPLKPDMEEERWRQHRERRLELKIEQKAR